MNEIFTYLSEHFESVLTIVGSVICGASAACALVPGGGLIKKILAILALNVRNATPEQIAKAKTIVDSAAALTKKEDKK